MSPALLPRAIESIRARAFRLAAPAVLAMILAGLPLAGTVVHEVRSAKRAPYRTAFRTLVPAPASDTWLRPTRWEYPAVPYRTASGLELLRPGFHRCSRGSILCTSHPAENLELRRPGNLAAGFRVNGGWKGERFPNPTANFLAVWRVARANGTCSNLFHANAGDAAAPATRAPTTGAWAPRR
jgi:hypothetical protein